MILLTVNSFSLGWHLYKNMHDNNRKYVGLKTAARSQMDVYWGEARCRSIRAGSLIAITNVDGAAHCLITALGDENRDFSIDAFELPGVEGQPLATDRFDAREMNARAASRDTKPENGFAATLFDAGCDAGETFLFKATQNTELWIMVPVSAGFLEGGGGGHFLHKEVS